MNNEPQFKDRFTCTRGELYQIYGDRYLELLDIEYIRDKKYFELKYHKFFNIARLSISNCPEWMKRISIMDFFFTHKMYFKHLIVNISYNKTSNNYSITHLNSKNFFKMKKRYGYENNREFIEFLKEKTYDFFTQSEGCYPMLKKIFSKIYNVSIVKNACSVAYAMGA